MANNLGEIQEPPQRERPRLVVPIVVIAALCVLAYIIVQLVINTKAQRIARTSHQLEAIAQVKPQMAELKSLVAKHPGFGNNVIRRIRNGRWYYDIQLQPTRMELMQYTIYEDMGWTHPHLQTAIGYLEFGADGTFLRGHNAITGHDYIGAALTSATR